MQCLLQNRPQEQPFRECRVPVVADLSQLANLLFIAFKHSIDEEQVDIDHPETEITNLFAGEYGSFLAPCSRVVEIGKEIVSATLITLWQDKPLLAFIMTCPTYQQQGLARQCLIHSMNALVHSGYHDLDLVVSAQNRQAVTLYRSLGFSPIH